MLKSNLHMILMLLAVAFFMQPTFAQDHNHQQGQGKGRMGGGMMGEGNRQDMQTIHALFAEHKKITRTIKNIDKGVETITESDDPKVQAMIKEHVAAMYQRLANKQPIRMWDPLFAELFKHTDKIKMEMVKTPKGIKVIETSDDPYVVKLVQAHAEGVSEFVREGMSSMHKEHPLPDTKVEAKKFLGKGDGVMTCPVTGEAVKKSVSADINGRTVYFCCESCRAAVLKNPELYLRMDFPNMHTFKLQAVLGEGKDKQVETLFEGPRRKLVQITLRNGAILSAHKAAEPITIQCIAGEGTLKVGEASEAIALSPGVLVTLEPNVLHEIKASPAIAILLSRFTEQ